MLKPFVPYVTQWFGSRFRRKLLTLLHYHLPKLFSEAACLEVYLALDDPFSYQLVQALPYLEANYNVCFKLFLTSDRQPENYLQPKLWRAWALQDAQQVGKLYQFSIPDKYPSLADVVSGQQLWQIKNPDVSQALTIFNQVWQQGFDEHFPPSTPVINQLLNAQYRQVKLGHYLPATIYFTGRWYWGVDRLDHLERKLLSLGLQKSEQPVHFSRRDSEMTANSGHVENEQPLEMYLSIRSPYSYIGLVKAMELCQRYDVPLKIKPVLPLVMRGMVVPVNKQKYIFLDTNREAEKYQIPYGKIYDPLGEGIEAGYEMFPYAHKEGKDTTYFLAVLRAIFAEGLDISKPDILKRIVESCQMDYSAAKEYAREHSWRDIVESNQQELQALNLWGVPSFKYGDFSCWGQDRLWQIAHQFQQQGGDKMESATSV